MENTLITPTGKAANRRARSKRKKAAVSEAKLATLVQWFEEAEEATCDARSLAERDRDYYDNKQLTADEIDALNKRGQPDIVINRIKPKIDFLLGLESQQRADPKAFPRTPMDDAAARAATDALRFVKDKENLDQLFSGVWEDMLISGLGGVEVQVRDGAGGEVEIDVKRWIFDRVFYDPHAHRHDLEDARYMGGVLWMDRDEAERRWPRKKELIGGTLAEAGGDQHFDDKPSWKQWAKRGLRPRVRIVQIYWEEAGTWRWAIFTKAGLLEAGEVPYRDDDGQPTNPMILQSAYVDRENNRYGVVRSLVGPQDEINKRRSKLLHMITVRQSVGERGAVDDVDAMKRELARADGHVEVNPGFRFELLDASGQAGGQAQLLGEAKSEIELLGPNAALQGKGDARASGRAIIASQQGGAIELSVLSDRHRHFKARVYRAIWQRIRQYWNKERWVRVTDDERNLRFVGFNRQVTAAERLRQEAIDEGVSEADADAQIAALAQDPARARQLQKVIGRENIPAEMDMDILIEEAPDTVTIQQEQFEQLAQMASAGVPIPPAVLIQASSLRNKQELLAQLEQNEQAQIATQIGVEREMAEIEKTKAQTEKARADALKTLAEADEKGGGPEPGTFGAGNGTGGEAPTPQAIEALIAGLAAGDGVSANGTPDPTADEPAPTNGDPDAQ